MKRTLNKPPTHFAIDKFFDFSDDDVAGTTPDLINAPGAGGN